MREIIYLRTNTIHLARAQVRVNPPLLYLTLSDYL